MSKISQGIINEKEPNNESFTKTLEEGLQFQEDENHQNRVAQEFDEGLNKLEKGQNKDQHHPNKSSQQINNNYSYMSSSEKQYLSSQQNLQYYDKYDYNAEQQPQPIRKNVIEAYHKLNDYVSDIQQRINEKMKKSEDEFNVAYKKQITQIQSELKALKKTMDDEILRDKANDKMNILTEERDYFKDEALRLDKICKEQEREIEELQFKQKVLTEDKNYYEGFVIETKKENKALKSELLQLYKFKAAEQKEQQNYVHQSQVGGFQPLNTGVSQMIQTVGDNGDHENGLELLQYASQNPRNEEIFLSEVKYNSQSGNRYNNNNKFTTVPTQVSSNVQTQQNFFPAQRAQTHHSKSRARFNEKTGSSMHDSKFQPYNSVQQPQQSLTEELQQTIQQLKENEEKYLETIKQLRIQLEKEKSNVKKAKASLSTTYSQRSELEQILLDCIAETKKDIQRRRAMQKADLIALQNTNLKKTQNALKGQLQILNDEDIPFTQFNQKDKMRILKQFISSDKFLDQIYQITFGHSKIPKVEKEKLLVETEDHSSQKSINKHKFQLTESWKQDAQSSSQIFQNFKGFKYSFKPQTASGSKSISSKDLRSSHFNFTEKTGKQIQLIHQLQIEPSQLTTPSLQNKHKLYKEVCKEFQQKQQDNKILSGI